MGSFSSCSAQTPGELTYREAAAGSLPFVEPSASVQSAAEPMNDDEARPTMAGAAGRRPAPYPPSYVNRLIGAVHRLPVPAPVLYASLVVALLAIEMLAKIADGTFPNGMRVIHLALPVFAVAWLPAVDGFGQLAMRALATARPLLVLEEQSVDEYRYRLTTLPRIPALISAALGLSALVILTLSQPSDTFQVLGIMTSTPTSAVEWTLQFLVWTGVGPTALMILRQMSLISTITARHTRIDLFALGPVYGWSRVTAAHTVFTVVVVVVATLALSSLAATVQWIVAAGAALGLAASAFVAPLWGAHRLIQREKDRRDAELTRTVNAFMANLEARIARNDLTDLDDVKAGLDGTLLIRRQVRDTSAWPWQPDTGRAVASVLLAPIAVYLFSKVLDTYVLH